MPMTDQDWQELEEEFAVGLDEYMAEWEESARAQWDAPVREQVREQREPVAPVVNVIVPKLGIHQVEEIERDERGLIKRVVRRDVLGEGP